MVYKGLPPKDEDARVNRIPKRFDKTIIDTDTEEVLRGIDLPNTAPQGVPWCEQTRKWWHNWRISPQSKLMTATDWDFLLDTAVMHNDIWRDRMMQNGKLFDGLSPTAKSNFEAEIRQRVAKFGATWEDRQKLQLAINSPLTEEEAEKRVEEQAKSAVDYAQRLAKAAAEMKGGKDVDDS